MGKQILNSQVSRVDLVQFLSTFFASLCVVNSGMVLGFSSVFLPHLLDEGLTQIEGFSLALAPFFGSILSTPILYNFVPKFGPKTCLCLTSYLNTISWISIAYSEKFSTLFLARVLPGICDTITYTSFQVYIEDIRGYGNENRIKIYTFFPVFRMAGIVLIGILGNVSSLQNAAFLSSAVPVLAFGLYFMPESAYFLISQNRNAEAKTSLRLTRESDEIEPECEEIKSELEHFDGFDFIQLFASPIRKVFSISVILNVSQQLSGISAIILFLSTINTKDSHFYFDRNFDLILFLILLAMSLFTTFILDCRDGKFFLIWSILGSSTSLIIVGWYFEFINYKGNDKRDALSLIPITAMLIYSIFYGLGLQNIPFVMTNQIFPRPLKSRILTLTLFFSNIFACFSSAIFTFFNVTFEINYAFYTVAALSVLSLVLIVFFVPNSWEVDDENKSLLNNHSLMNIDKNSASHYQMLNSFDLSDFSE